MNPEVPTRPGCFSCFRAQLCTVCHSQTRLPNWPGFSLAGFSEPAQDIQAHRNVTCNQTGRAHSVICRAAYYPACVDAPPANLSGICIGPVGLIRGRCGVCLFSAADLADDQPRPGLNIRVVMDTEPGFMLGFECQCLLGPESMNDFHTDSGRNTDLSRVSGAGHERTIRHFQQAFVRTSALRRNRTATVICWRFLSRRSRKLPAI